MSRKEFYLLLDELLQCPPGTVQGGETLAAFPKWDSVALIGFITLLHHHFSLILPASKIMACRTPAELGDLAGPKLR